ncbi:MAG: hypothetical protein QXJ17_04770 [Nitrososphaeria archaeon]
MAFEVQELPDIIKLITLLRLSEDGEVEKLVIKRDIDKYCKGYTCVDIHDIEKALHEMTEEGLITNPNGKLKLTERGLKLSTEWKKLLLKKEPIMEVIAGLADGSITGLVVILSALVAGLTTSITTFTAVLSLTSVAITNFSSFLLGGKTEDIADLLTLKYLIDYSLSDIPDKLERKRSLDLVKHLFIILNNERNKGSIYSALISGATTFFSGVLPIITFLTLPRPINIIISIGIVSIIIGVFLVKYRAKKTNRHWKITLAETAVIVFVAILASLLIGRL